MESFLQEDHFFSLHMYYFLLLAESGFLSSGHLIYHAYLSALALHLRSAGAGVGGGARRQSCLPPRSYCILSPSRRDGNSVLPDGSVTGENMMKGGA